MADDNLSDVRDLLDALSDGRMTLDQVAQRFRGRKWIYRSRREYSSYQEKMASHLEDSDPPLPGSFADVTAALHRDQITIDQYRVLSEAAAEAIAAQEDSDS